MGSAALVLAWLLSLAPLLLERAGFLDLSRLDPQSTPRLALCALPWIAIAGLPRGSLGKRDLRAWWGSCMACAPVLSLALALDVQSGSAWSRVAIAASFAFAFIALSALAADLARLRARSAALHAWLWTLFVVGLPLFVAALSWGARALDSHAPQWSRIAAQSSPLHWALAAVDGSPSPYAALLLAIALCALAAFSSRGEPA